MRFLSFFVLRSVHNHPKYSVQICFRREKGRRALDTQRKHTPGGGGGGAASRRASRSISRRWIIQGVLIRSADRQTDSGSADRCSCDFFPAPSAPALLASGQIKIAEIGCQLRRRRFVDATAPGTRLSRAPCTAVGAALLHSCTAPSTSVHQVDRQRHTRSQALRSSLTATRNHIQLRRHKRCMPNAFWNQILQSEIPNVSPAFGHSFKALFDTTSIVRLSAESKVCLNCLNSAKIPQTCVPKRVEKMAISN